MTEKQKAHPGHAAAKRLENLQGLDEMPRSALVNAEQAAAYLGVAPGTLAVWRCTSRQKLSYIKLGRAVRYRVADLQDFVERGAHVHTDKMAAG